MPPAAAFFLALACLAGLAAPAQSAVQRASAGRVAGDYVFEGAVDLGAPGGWDYANVDGAGRFYVGHADRIDVVDLATRKLVGSVGPLSEAHGAAIDNALGHGFATSGGDGMLAQFDLATLSVIRKIPVGADADGVIFDPATRTVLVAVGDGKKLVIVDAAAGAVTHAIDLPGPPEFLAADGRGKVFVNIVSTAQLARIDIASGRLEAVWPLTGCRGPHGLAYDRRTGRLFSGCANAVMLAIDPASGRVVATISTGPRNDAVAVDEARGRVFSPNGDGTLTVVQEGARDSYKVLRTIPTFLGARSMAIDPGTGRLYLTFGDAQIRSARSAPGGVTFGWNGAKVAIFAPNN